MIRIISIWRLNKLKRIVWQWDMVYRRHIMKQQRHSTKIAEYKSHNSINYERYSEFTGTKQLFIRLYPIAVASTDVLLAFIVLSQLTAHLSDLPPLLTAFLGALMIAFIEICLGAFLDRSDERIEDVTEQVQEDGTDNEKRFSVSVEKIKHAVASFFAFCVILIVPIISLSEYFAQLGILDTQVQLGYMTAQGWEESVQGLQLKYGGLAGLSLISHGFVVFFTGKLFSAFSAIFYKTNLTALEHEEEVFLEREIMYQGYIINALLKYDDKRMSHIARYGHHAGLHEPNFSKYIMNVYRGIRTTEDQSSSGQHHSHHERQRA